MKKLFVIAVALAAVFGFTAGAFAADVVVCTNCSKCPIGHIACDIPGAQAKDNCKAFDYDARYGYDCPLSTDNSSVCKAIFNICDCIDQTKFAEGQVIGVRMTILVNDVPGQNGAYWSSGANANVKFGMYATEAEICASTTQDRKFGSGKFYKSDLETIVTTFTADSTCVVPLANQATVIITDEDKGYTITATDTVDKLSHWWIDIAPIRIDPNVLHNGERISVKIELLNQGAAGICAKCAPVCECTIDVAIVCCPSPITYKALLFPYFTSLGEDADGWWNGIAIDNLSSKDGTATLTAYEMDGNMFTATVPVLAGGMYVNLLQLMSWSGTGSLGDARCYIKVTTDFDVDGFAMIARDTGESMGYLPRQ